MHLVKIKQKVRSNLAKIKPFLPPKRGELCLCGVKLQKKNCLQVGGKI